MNISSIPGVVEDTTEIILNLKELKIKLYGSGPKTLRVSVKGERNVVAADIQTDGNVEILNPQLHLATLTEEDAASWTWKSRSPKAAVTLAGRSEQKGRTAHRGHPGGFHLHPRDPSEIFRRIGPYRPDDRL